MPLNDFVPSEPLALARLDPSPFQTRKIADDAPDIRELAATIASVGVIQPIVVRRLADSERLEIVAGDRRFRAARFAGEEFIPGTVHNLTDQEAREIVAVENLHRKDLHYLEEAAAIQSLIDGGWNVAKIADHFGKSPGWIARRANLLKLTDRWREAIASGEHSAARWPAGCLELIARLPAEAQEDAFEDTFDWDDATVETMESYCVQHTHLLSNAGWSLDDPLVFPLAGACSQCVKRSCCQPGLFDELDEPDPAARSAKDRCLDPICWGKKQAAVVAKREANLRQKHKDLILIHRGMDTRPDDCDSRPDYEFKECKKSAEGAKPAMLVTGPNTGKQVWVQPLQSSLGSGREKPKRQADPATGKPAPRSIEERTAELQKRRRLRAVELIAEYVVAVAGEKYPSAADLMWLAVVFGTTNRRDSNYDVFYDDAPDAIKLGADANADPQQSMRHSQPFDRVNAWDRFMALSSADSQGDLESRLWRSIQPVLLRRLRPVGADKLFESEKLLNEAKHLLAVVDPKAKVDDFYRRAVEAIPMAKSWTDMTDPDAPTPVAAAEPPAKSKGRGKKTGAKATAKAAGDVPF